MAQRLIEIKGLASSIADAKRGIAEVRGASANLNVSSAALVAELNDVTAQLESARSDLKFEAATLGNSPPEERLSEEPAKPSTLPPPLQLHSDSQEPPQDPSRSIVR